MRRYAIALAGNPNCGKTTFFNALTGAKQRVGNFPGVTVERREGALLNCPREAAAVDLPGIYSLAPFSAEERVAREFLVRERPDAIINVVDATNLERNLYLTFQLLELEIPVVVALNMMDEAREAGTRIDLAGLSAALGAPVIAAAASSGEGVGEVASAALAAARSGAKPTPPPLGGEVEKALAKLERILDASAVKRGASARRTAAELLEGGLTLDGLDLSLEQSAEARRAVAEVERAAAGDACAALAGAWYAAIERLCAANVRKGGGSPSRRRTARIDAIVTHRVFGLPLLALALALIFECTFGAPGRLITGLMEGALAALSAWADAALGAAGAGELARSLVVDGALAGVGGVLAFLPSILTLFLLLSLLEDCGYMARVAYIMDRPLSAVGLTGRSVVPMLAGFGCSVPAVLATRTLPTERDRKLTSLVVPFMSCSAKLPVYAIITAALLSEGAALATACLYLAGVLIGLGYCVAFKKTLSNEGAPFLIELPDYRFPTARNVALALSQRTGDFLKKAFSVIFLSSLAVWLLQRFDFSLNLAADPSQSALAAIGRAAAPVFAPLGFGDWRVVTALVAGLAAKEAAAGALSALFSGAGVPLTAALAGVLTPLSACSLLVFILLYMPCFAAVSAIKKELGSALSAALAMLCQTVLAWLCSFAVFSIGTLLGF